MRRKKLYKKRCKICKNRFKVDPVLWNGINFKEFKKICPQCILNKSKWKCQAPIYDPKNDEPIASVAPFSSISGEVYSGRIVVPDDDNHGIFSSFSFFDQNINDKHFYDMNKCVGCGHELSEDFPPEYPKDKMLCCQCLVSLYWYLGLDFEDIVEAPYLYDHHTCKEQWWQFGKKIMKGMKIQSGGK